MNESEEKQNKYDFMTKTPVKKLILKLCVPTIISMLVTGLYNSADTFFVGKISTQATAAVGIVFSVMAMIQAMGFMCGQGSGSFLARMLGANDEKQANEAASTGFALSILLGVFIAVLGIIFVEPIADMLGATDATLEDTKKYGLEGRDSDALYQLMLATEGVQAVVFLRQDTETTCTGGFRSLEEIDVSQVAAKFGGGGHKNAIGMSCNGKIETLLPQIVKEFARIM